MAWRRAPILSRGVRTGCAARLAILAKRLQCGQLAGAFGPPTAPQSGSKLHALQALRDIRLRLPRCEICRLGRLEAAYHYPQFRNAVAANLQGIVSSSRAGLPLRSFRQPFTINPKSGSSNREIRNTRKDMNLQLEACSPRPSAGEAGLVVRTLGAPLFSAYFAYSAVPIAFFRLTRHNLGRSGMRPYQLPRTTRRFLSVSSAQSVVTHFEHGQFTVSS